MRDAPGPEDAAYGSGRFGRWTEDAAGLPAYAYGPPPELAGDHWHLAGNDRIAATAHAAGHVQLYDWVRGGKLLNEWAPARRQYSGGFVRVEINGRALTTLAPALPGDAVYAPVFGVGYFEKRTRIPGIAEVTERVSAPLGDDPVLVCETTIRNLAGSRSALAAILYWGVNPLQLTPAPIMTHGLDRFWNWRRRRLNRHFLLTACWHPETRALTADFTARDARRAPPVEHRAGHDWHMESLFLAALEPLPEDFAGYCACARALFPDGGPEMADFGVVAPRPLPRESALHRAEACLALRWEAELGPGESAARRFVFGYGALDAIPELTARHARPGAAPPRPSIVFESPEAPGWIGREMAWHSYYLQAGSFYQEYFDAHFVDQGSAYSYLQGGSGAHRDFALFTLPMVYLRPDLAREMLRFTMRSQHWKRGKLPYAHYGYGKSGGAGVHSLSSDLDLFFLWALGEYLGATRDLDFLDEELLYYPREAGHSGSVLEHARMALAHLRERVGFGPHGLLRCGTGDWNDVLLAFSRFALLTIWRGESALNAGLATVAGPALADAVEAADPEFAGELRALAKQQAAALEAMWNGRWLTRGYTGIGDRTLGHDRIFLDAQAFPVLGGVWDAARRAELFAAIDELCARPQGVGARCLWPPMRGPLLQPGSDTNGGTWAAIDAWIACAWALHDPAAAWDFFQRATLAARAEAYPEVWYGVWSGPDSYNAHYHPRPGETFDLNATPMAKYPVMNMNRHAGPLLALLHLAGIRPEGGGVTVAPRVPLRTFRFSSPLIRVSAAPGALSIGYTPVCDGVFRFRFRAPEGLDGPPGAVLDGDALGLRDAGAGWFEAEVSGKQGVPFEIAIG